MPTKRIDPTPSAYEYHLLIKQLMQTPLNLVPEQEIVYRDLHRCTYAEWAKRIAQLTNALEALGVKAGDTVGVMDWDSHRYLECYFAVPMLGAVLHTVNIRMSPQNILYTLNHAEDDVLLINADFLPILEAIRPQLETVKRIVLLSDGEVSSQASPDFDGEYEQLLAQSSSTYDFPDFDENSVATTFYTTGTTGPPKGVYFSHRQLILHAFGVMAAFNYCRTKPIPDEVYMPLTPLFHVNAWGYPHICTFLGAKQVYPGRYEPETILKLVTSEKVTISHCVPTILHMIVAHPAAKEVDLSNWRINIGGSALNKSLCKAALDLGITILSSYGMSESCPALTFSYVKPHMLDWDNERQAEVRSRTGFPMPLASIKTVDAEGNTLPHDGKSVGEVVARTPWLTQGYLNEAEQSEVLWADGWLHTGDIGYFDEEGCLQLTDRIKDVIKTGGEWISSLKLEGIITQHKAVSEAAVVGVPDDRWGERPVVLVVLQPGLKGKVDEEELKGVYVQSFEDGTIPKYGVPDRIIFADFIPKTSVGKIDKKAIRESLKQ
jgi:fatty-acyl-CoA synthase